jgi:hypothetical protein
VQNSRGQISTFNMNLKRERIMSLTQLCFLPKVETCPLRHFRGEWKGIEGGPFGMLSAIWFTVWVDRDLTVIYIIFNILRLF